MKDSDVYNEQDDYESLKIRISDLSDKIGNARAPWKVLTVYGAIFIIFLLVPPFYKPSSESINRPSTNKDNANVVSKDEASVSEKVSYLEETRHYRYKLITILSYNCAFITVLACATHLTIRNIVRRRRKHELIVLTAKLQSRMSAMTATDRSTYFDKLVDINISNLEAYYVMVKVHTDNSFYASIATGLLGFVLILSGLVIGLVKEGDAKYVSYASSSTGVIIEFMAGVFFYLYNQTTRQLKGYHDSLIGVQNILLSFKIVGDTPDGNAKTEMLSTMIKSLIRIDQRPAGNDAMQQQAAASEKQK